MKIIQAKKMTRENFRIYGDYQNVLIPDVSYDRESADVFLPDLMTVYLGGDHSISYSALKLKERDPILEKLEYHLERGEVIFPVDADIVMLVAPPVPPDQDIPYEAAEAFYVPQGTAVYLKPGVWHLSPFLRSAKEGTVLCMLPRRTYASDAVLVDLPQEKKFFIKFQ